MLINLRREPQPATGTGLHWETYALIMAQPDLITPLREAIVLQVDSKVAADPNTQIQSNLIGAIALQVVGPWWHGEFSRSFPGFNSGGLTGMILWSHLVNRPDRWAFEELKDFHGQGQNPKLYWRLLRGNPLLQDAEC